MAVPFGQMVTIDLAALSTMKHTQEAGVGLIGLKLIGSLVVVLKRLSIQSLALLCLLEFKFLVASSGLTT